MGPKWFDEDIAKRMLESFSEHREGIECLLVHCARGKNRSPGVAKALNEIFGLGVDSRQLARQYSEFNFHVYQTLINVAEEIGIP